MSKILNPEKLLSSILKIQSHLYSLPMKDGKPHNINYFNEFSKNENSIKIIFDHEQFKIKYISENVESLIGYSVDDFYKSSIFLVFKITTIEHFNFIYIWLKWAVSIHIKLGHLYNSKQVICGVKIKHKDGRTIRMMLRYLGLEMTENGAVKVAAISIDDVTHIMKSDNYWGRFERKDEGESIIHHFFSTDKNDIPNEIISEREKDVLLLLAEGKESKEIAKLLFISPHTVDNHRRNMIHKIGVKDTTGLIQICKMSGII
jgi:DNA-binding CsgD family transcriptional regulator